MCQSQNVRLIATLEDELCSATQSTAAQNTEAEGSLEPGQEKFKASLSNMVRPCLKKAEEYGLNRLYLGIHMCIYKEHMQ